MGVAESKRFFDVVILGSDIEQLICAALLLKQGFTVLVVGQNTPPPSYKIGNLELPTAPSFFTGGNNPILRKVLQKLALQSPYKNEKDFYESIHFAFPNHRIDLNHYEERLRSEFKREFPYSFTLGDEMMRNANEISHNLDEILKIHLHENTGDFFKRYRAQKQLENTLGLKLWENEIAASHPLKVLSKLPALFFSNVEKNQISDWINARFFQQLMNRSPEDSSNALSLHNQLIDKIQQLGGSIATHDKATQFVIQGKSVKKVYLESIEGFMSCRHVICGISHDELSVFIDNQEFMNRLHDQIGNPRTRFLKYTLNLGIEKRFLPSAIEKNLFLTRKCDSTLSEENACFMEVTSMQIQKTSANNLCVQVLLPRIKVENRSCFKEEIVKIRRRLLENLNIFFPFLKENILWTHSPHDVLPLQVTPQLFGNPNDTLCDMKPLPMEPIYSFSQKQKKADFFPQFKTPLKNLFLCHRESSPSMGIEGRIMAADMVSNFIAKKDHRMERKKKSLWSKMPS